MLSAYASYYPDGLNSSWPPAARRRPGWQRSQAGDREVLAQASGKVFRS